MEEKILSAIEGLAAQVGTLTGQMGDLTDRVDGLSTRVSDLTDKVDLQGIQIKENTQILKALEHLAQVNRAEHDKMSCDFVELKGDVQGIKESLAKVELITASNWGDIVKLKSVR